jgi:hypothetical protein
MFHRAITAPAPPGQTRLATIGRGPAMALLLALILLVGYGLAAGPKPVPLRATTAKQGDVALYAAIRDRVAAGQDYYHAAAAEQRLRGYPLRPFVTMRPPTLAWLSSRLGPSGTPLALRLLALMTGAVTIRRLRSVLPSQPLWAATSFVVAIAMGLLSQPEFAAWHEIWAGFLIALAFACRTERHWWASLAPAVAAVLFRELALPILIAMAAMAAVERRWREVGAWTAAILLVAGLLAAHHAAVQAVLLPGDRASQGWTRAGGWPFDLSLAWYCTLFGALPKGFTALLLPLALLGWGTWRDGYAGRVALAFAGWLVPFLLIGRPENFYWGLMLAPLLPAGVVLALPALRDLVRSIMEPVPVEGKRGSRH